MLYLWASCKKAFSANSLLASKLYPRNIIYMPVVKFFGCLDFEQKSSFCKRPLLIQEINLYFKKEGVREENFNNAFLSKAILMVIPVT